MEENDLFKQKIRKITSIKKSNLYPFQLVWRPDGHTLIMKKP